MKKTALALSMMALFATSAQAATVYDADGVSADVYGRMQFDISNDGSDTDGVGSARMGFKGKSAINDKVSGIAKGEWQIASENNEKETVKTNSSQFTARHLYAGFEFADYGTVVFGQTDTAFYQAVAATDIFNTYGYEAFTLIEDGRQEGQIVYNGSFSGFYVGASYQFRNEDFALEVGNPENPQYVPVGKLDNAYALTLGYEFDFGLAMYAAYHLEELEAIDKSNYALSASYSLNDLYLGAALVGTDIDGENITGFDVVASYQLAELKLYTGYAMQDADDAIIDAGYLEADAFKLGADYKFNGNIHAWAEFLLDNADDADNQFTVALQYNF